jgi:ABC-2 type transport system permease protein
MTGAGALRRALRAEWRKTWTDRGTPWLLAALVAVTAGISAVTVAAAACTAAGCRGDPGRVSLTGIYAGEAAAALAGVLVGAGEYGTGMIRVTLAAIPGRGRLLTAKAAVLAAVAGAASTASAVAATGLGQLLLPGRGYTAARGFDLADAAMWRACLCAALCLTLTALLGLGIAVAVRDAVAATGIALGLLYLFPVAAGLFHGSPLAWHLQQAGPLTAAADSIATAGTSALPLSPWQGLGVAAAWAAAALAAGSVLLRVRDA